MAAYDADIRLLEIAAGRAWWQANVTGSDADFAAKAEAQNRLDAALADPARFEELTRIRKAFKAASPSGEPVLARQIDVVYLAFLGKQLDKELLERMTALENGIEQKFNVYRAKVDGKELTDSEVRTALRSSKDSARSRAVWEANKAVGAAVEADLKELVKLRNEAAGKLGYANYHAMQLALGEQDQEQVIKLFDELHELTREPFGAVKAAIDAKLAKNYGIEAADLRPWHYHDPFFQEPPAVFETDLDTVYKDVDILKLCRAFYAGIGLPIDDVIERSDLFEKKGKSPHAFCIDIDQEGDVRVLANIVPNEYWMATMLHELGHAVYSSKNIPQTVPYVLRTPAHSLTTEGIAMMFERFSKDGNWLTAMGVTVPDVAAFNAAGAAMRRYQLLIFAAWSQVMLRFEKAMYENPEQDLNKLWWDLVEKYQLVRRPEGRNAPDYAAKIHVVSAPVYYHNYLMGELFECQLDAAIAREVLDGAPAGSLYNGNVKVGEYLKRKVFGPARTRTWNDLIRHATGAGLNAQAFAAALAEK